jgi:leucyl aminopeptidase (aminopeptidase T)
MPAGESDAAESRLARWILTKSLRLGRGTSVVIETWRDQLDFAEEIAIQARLLGIRPMITYEGERAMFEAQERATVADGVAISSADLAAVAAADGYVVLPGPSDIKRWREIPAARRTAYDRWLGTWNQVLREHSVRCAYIHYGGATPRTAEYFGVDLEEWRAEAREATEVDPAIFRRGARRIVNRLSNGHRLTITHENGTHLDLGLVGRAPRVEDGSIDAGDLRAGEYWTVLPGGYLIVPLNPRLAEGRFIATRPARHRSGNNPGIRWEFHAGRLISYESDDPTGWFQNAYEGAGKERDKPALLSIGLNPKLHEAPLLEDQARGVVTMYIGRNQDFGGRTPGMFRDYALIEGADLTVDGKPIVTAGRPL